MTYRGYWEYDIQPEAVWRHKENYQCTDCHSGYVEYQYPPNHKKWMVEDRVEPSRPGVDDAVLLLTRFVCDH